MSLIYPRFTIDDAQSAADAWGFNCGPAVLAMVAGLTPTELRPHLGDFESKGYTNPTLMFECLNRLQINWRARQPAWPSFGLVRVQWEGPWTLPGVPIRVRYRHTHWVGAERIPGQEPYIFDVNCMCVDGWVPISEWHGSVVPWLLEQCEPKANGKWHLTHVLEVPKPNLMAAPFVREAEG